MVLKTLKVFVVVAVLGIFSFLAVSPALARCDFKGCIPDLQGTCNNGAVIYCDLRGLSKCNQTTWEDVPIGTPQNPDCQYINPGTGAITDMQKALERNPMANFQSNLEKCAKGESMNSDCWLAGTEQFDLKSGGFSGIVPGFIKSLILVLSGPLPTGNQIAYKPGGAIGSMLTWMDALYTNPPVQTKQYFAYVKNQLGLPGTQSAYAQGIGFNALSYLLPLWKAVRDLSYLIFVIMFVFVAFSIMFRSKIDAQRVVSLQIAIPKIIIALVMVTFSYAIAGLLVDSIYLIFYLITDSLRFFGGISTATATQWKTSFNTGNIINELSALAKLGQCNLITLIKSLFPDALVPTLPMGCP